MIVRYYAIANRRYPFVALVDEWPSSTRMARQCQKGVWLAIRKATGEEAEQARFSIRHVAYGWESMEDMLGEIAELHPDFYPKLKTSIDYQTWKINELLSDVEKKRVKHRTRKETS